MLDYNHIEPLVRVREEQRSGQPKVKNASMVGTMVSLADYLPALQPAEPSSDVLTLRNTQIESQISLQHQNVQNEQIKECP